MYYVDILIKMHFLLVFKMRRKTRKTTVERSQAYRDKIKADPVKYQEWLKRDRERYLRKKEGGVVKAMSDGPKRQQRTKKDAVEN